LTNSPAARHKESHSNLGTLRENKMITEWSYPFYLYNNNSFDFTRYPIDLAKIPKEEGLFILARHDWQLPEPIYLAQTKNLFQSIIDVQNREKDKWREVELLYFLPKSVADFSSVQVDAMLIYHKDSLRAWGASLL
jgi:hypothetical protein